MNIHVRLFATLREGRDKTIELELPENSTVAEVIRHLSLARKDIAILLVGGHDAPLEKILTDGDTVSLFPPVGGG